MDTVGRSRLKGSRSWVFSLSRFLASPFPRSSHLLISSPSHLLTFSSPHLLIFSSPHLLIFPSPPTKIPKSRKRGYKSKNLNNIEYKLFNHHKQLTPNSSSTVTATPPPFHTMWQSEHEQLDRNTTAPIHNPIHYNPIQSHSIQSYPIQSNQAPSPSQPSYPQPCRQRNETKKFVQEAVSQA